MTSYQEPTPGSKSAKFIQSNPLDPMIRPFQGLSDEQQDVQRQVAKNVNERLERAMEELKEKHRRGTNEMDHPDRAPTGLPYRQQRFAMQKSNNKSELERESAETKRWVEEHTGNDSRDEDNPSDSDYDDLLDDDDDDDPVLEALRQRRLEEMKQARMKKAAELARGHGEYTTISQDEFLGECTGASEFVVVHFFHKEFERCKIMDHHLKIIAPLHTECKFIRIDAEKAPFFVAKLQVRTLPTLIVLRDGKTVHRLTGFEGLSKDKKDPDVWETSRLQEWIAGTGAIDFKTPHPDIQEEMARLGLRSTVIQGGIDLYDEDF